MLIRSALVIAALTLGAAQPALAHPRAAASQSSDAAVAAAVKKALSGQSDLRKLAVSVEGSQATLTGRLPTLWLKLDAVKRTLKVDGVKTVVSEMELSKGESDVNLAVALGRAIDGYAYYTVFDYIDAVIRRGVITLTGSVTPDNRNKVEELGEIVAKIRGVQDLQNNIMMLPTSQGDDDIRSAMYSRITNSASFENEPIDRAPSFRIVVDHGSVTLWGFVQSEIERRELESIARYTNGVLRVTNNLKTRTKSR